MSERAGRLIRKLRQERGLTQRRFAELIGMNFTYLSKMENGRLGTTPSTDTLVRMADVLEVDRDWLLTQCGRVPESMERRISVEPEIFERLGKLQGSELRALLNRAAYRLVGQVPAGQPVEAVEDVEAFDLVNFFSPDEHFLLRVRGDSMVEDGIHDGDIAVVHPQASCETGDVVVALVDGQEATLKRFCRRGGQICLQPANSAMQPVLLDWDRVEVCGKVVGLIRTHVA